MERPDEPKMNRKVDGSDASPPSNEWRVSDEVEDWVDILQAIEEGRPPDKKVLAKLLRTSKVFVAQPVRDYLADYLEGKIRKPRGRPLTVETIAHIERDFIVRVVYSQTVFSARKIPKSKRSGSTPSEIALEETVSVLAAEKNIHMSTGQVSKIVYPKGASRKVR
jgi:hypothetical protein